MSEENQTPLPDTVDNASEEQAVSAKEIEKQEEEKLKSRYPTRALSGPAFLQKRLAKGQKYFDSGDYQMAKQKGPAAIPKTQLPTTLDQPTGEAIPTPDTVPVRKTSIIQSKLANPAT